jgi:hypothetical protein
MTGQPEHGSRVIAASTITSTTAEIPTPPAETNGSPAKASPRIATTTVPPAKTTACPAVAMERPTDSATGTPAARYSRWRDSRNRA